MHNPRAEVAKANGCSMEEFFELMREDDVLDAGLTALGREQAKSIQFKDKDISLVVSSPLSRALETADLVYPMQGQRVCCEVFREVNGELLNGKRRTKTELENFFPNWNFEDLEADHDHLWTPKMEDFHDVAERGYQGLCWLLDRPEDAIMLVCHGGILRYTMNLHPSVTLVDKRTSGDKEIQSRFDNCEVRRYILSWGTTIDGSRKKVQLAQVDSN